MMEKTLQDLFDSLDTQELDALWDGELTLSLPGGTRRRLAASLLSAPGSTPGRVRGARKLRRTVLIAAVLAGLLLVSALALYLSGARFFRELLPEESYRQAEDYIFSELCTAENESCRAVLECAMRDGHYCTMILSLERLDGGSLEGTLPELDVEVSPAAGRLRPGTALEWLETAENTAEKRHYLLVCKSIAQYERVELTLRGLRTGGEQELWDEPLTLSAALTSAPTLSGEQGDMQLTLSPFGLWIDLSEEWEGTNLLSSGRPVHTIRLVYADGTEKGATAEEFRDRQRMEELGWGAEQMPNNSGRSYITIRFTFFEDLSKITAVRIDDTLIPLQKTG